LGGTGVFKNKRAREIGKRRRRKDGDDDLLADNPLQYPPLLTYPLPQPSYTSSLATTTSRLRGPPPPVDFGNRTIQTTVNLGHSGNSVP